ncbi:MAG: hypothetical protein NTW86_22435 [Candidatus Sumerlaeota bacterium]|nr:hypothetical protein [Candidatus Sumerlaeota bacterium]
MSAKPRDLLFIGMFGAMTAMAAAQATQPSAKPESPGQSPPATFVFVPYEKMKGPQLGKDQSVLLPYAEFLRLKGTAGARVESPKFQPSASLAQAVYTGAVEGGDVARLDAVLTLEALARPTDTLEIRLPFAGAALESAAVEGPTAWVAPLSEGSGLRVFLRGEGARTVKLKLASKMKTDGALKRLDVGVPRAAAASLALRVGEDVALTPSDDTLPATVARAADGTVEIKASAGGADALRLAFHPRVEATGAAAQIRFAVDEQILLSVSSQSARAHATLKIDMLAGTANSIGIQLPPAARLLSVSGSFVKDWSAPDAKGVTTVSLVRGVTEDFDLALETQIDSPEASKPAAQAPPSEKLEAPEFRVPAATRESGLITVAPDAGLSVWPEEKTGLEAVSTPGKEGGDTRAFRFAQPGWRLTLSRQLTPARVRSQGVLLYEVTDEFIRLKSRHQLAIRGRGLFEATFDVPENYELREAGPPDLVSGFRQQGKQVTVNFRGEQKTDCAVQLTLERPRTAAGEKAAPGGKGSLILEPIRAVGADEDAGTIVLAAPVALRITEISASGLEATDVRALQETLAPMLGQEMVPVLGYRYFTPKFNAVASIERQRTRATCDTSLLASLQPSLMAIHANLDYNVEFSATDQFQLLLPASAGEDVVFQGQDIKEKNRAPAPGKTAAGDALTTWTIRLQRRVIGPYRLSASFEQPLAEAESGKPVQVAVPTVRAVGVARETGFLAVSRGENFEVRVAKSDGLEPRDVKELPANLASAFLGFRYFDPQRRALTLELIRHELAPVLGALIRRMHIETVLSDQREAIHEVYCEIQNNREQYLELKLPQGMEIWSAFVRGAPVRSSTRQSDGARLIELTKSESLDQAFRVRVILRETLPGGSLGLAGALRFNPPTPLNMPTLRTTWKLYLPAKWSYVDFGGGMQLVQGGAVPWIEPAAEKLLNDLPAGIAGGVAQAPINPPLAKVVTQYQTAESEEEKKARLQGVALEIPIVREGRQFEFSKLSGVGTIEVHYWKPKPLLLLQGGLALVLFIGLMVAMARRKRLAIGWIALLIALIGASLAEGLPGRLFSAALAASLAALLVGLAVRAVAAARRTVTTAPASGPPLPPPGPSPEARAEGPSETQPPREG